MLAPLQEHALLLFWLQLLVLFLGARGLGLLARRIGQPPVVGELLAGLIIGPSLFGRLFPSAAGWLFPGDEFSSGLILSVAWVGVVILLIETGFETDLDLLGRIGRSTAMVPLGSLVLPLAFGIGMGFLMPDVFLSKGGDRVIFALFMGVALAVSALPVVAKILIEMGLMRRNVGQIILVAGMADDIVGWVMLSTLVGSAATGKLEPVKLGLTVVAIVAFLAFAFTAGQRMTNSLLRRGLRHSEGGMAVPLSALMAIVLSFAALTQVIGIEAVFGAFVAGIVIGRSRFFRRDFEHIIHSVGHGFLTPIFFATAGMFVDVWQLANPTALLWTGIVIAVASAGKLIGSYVGARMGPLGHREAIAVGFGLNARGALEVIIATIALSIGVFNPQTYTIIVLLAITTSVAAPPFLRWALERSQMSEEEAERLQREEVMQASVIAKSRNALLPIRGGANSALAARVLDLVLRPGAHVTVMTVMEEDDDRGRMRECADRVLASLQSVEAEFHAERHPDVVAAIVEEAGVGYDLLALGLNEDFSGARHLSDRLRGLVARTPAPLLLVRRGAAVAEPADGFRDATFRRVLVPVTGTRIGLAAEEVAYTLGSRQHIDVDALHVLTRQDQRGAESPGEGQLDRTRALADRMGGGTATLLREGTAAHEEIVTAALERDADVIVLATQLRSHDGDPFLGQGVEYVLEHATQTVIVVVFPGSVDRALP